MFWFIYEWQSIPDYFIFLGLFYLALIVIGCGLAFVVIKSLLELVGVVVMDKHETGQEPSEAQPAAQED